MSVGSDIEIANGATLKPIIEIAQKLGLNSDDIEQYGQYKAKIKPEAVAHLPMDGKLILVAGMTPTPAGEGKTTVTVGLGQAFGRLGKNASVALREPSLGPCLGIKGGAAGGGYSQVLPMEDINLHFTGDLHAVSTAHNLLAALIDNALYHRNRGQLDPRRIEWRRVMDMNDRALRNVVVGTGAPTDGVPRQTGFDITAASEVMAALCLAEDLDDLKDRMGRFIVGYDYDKAPVFARDLLAQGSMAAMLKEAVKPNLVQTIEGTPAFVHGGPFANIAHGTNSVIADKMALRLNDYVITEAGFGFDLGGEKFFNIMCRSSGLSPSCVVLVATARALKMHGGVPIASLKEPNTQAVIKGFSNLSRHIESAQHFGVPIVVAINRFTHDTDEEVNAIKSACTEMGVDAEVVNVWRDGGGGAIEAAQKVIAAADGFEGTHTPLYADEDSIEHKIKTVATKIYGASDVQFTRKAELDLKRIERIGVGHFPVCMAKTQKSLSDDPKQLGRPTDFSITVREIAIAAGAGFVVPITGNIMRMPGLAKEPAAIHIDVNQEGQIEGLF
jgi:formate--tetrahydrofolate ligase